MTAPPREPSPTESLQARRGTDAYLEVAPDQVRFPAPPRSPWWALTRRLLMAIGVLAVTVLLVYFDRDGYRDANDPPPTRSTSPTPSTTRP